MLSHAGAQHTHIHKHRPSCRTLSHNSDFCLGCVFRETFAHTHPEYGPNVCVLAASGQIQLSLKLSRDGRSRTTSCAHDVSYTVFFFFDHLHMSSKCSDLSGDAGANHVTHTFKLCTSWDFFSEGRSSFQAMDLNAACVLSRRGQFLFFS